MAWAADFGEMEAGEDGNLEAGEIMTYIMCIVNGKIKKNEERIRC
jgi:hypothetical protein